MTSEKSKSNYFRSTGDALNSFLLVLPLMIFYQLGIYLSNFQNLNGADLITPMVILYLGKNGLMVFHFVLLLTLIALYANTNKKGKMKISYIPLVIVESILYSFLIVILINLILHSVKWQFSLLAGAILLFLPYFYFALKKQKDSSLSRMILLTSEILLLLLMGGIAFVMVQKGRGLDWTTITQQEVFNNALRAVGAGVNEELFFRLILFGSLFLLATKYFEWDEFHSFLLSALISAALFSYAHHIVPGGEPFEMGVFLYRFLAGLIFCIIYATRGFAVAVYTHSLYNFLVFFKTHWNL